MSGNTTTTTTTAVDTKNNAGMVNGCMVWIDCEMTGLDLKSDKIIEIAAVITDGQLNIIDKGVDIVINQPKSLMDNMNEWCIHHHGESGLTAQVLESKITTKQAEQHILDLVKKYCPKPRIALLAGNSVHVDRQFISNEMPELNNYLHYRIADVSTIKELAKRWTPDIFKNMPSKKENHRALDDILESIEELKYYKKHVFNC